LGNITPFHKRKPTRSQLRFRYTTSRHYCLFYRRSACEYKSRRSRAHVRFCTQLVGLSLTVDALKNPRLNLAGSEHRHAQALNSPPFMGSPCLCLELIYFIESLARQFLAEVCNILCHFIGKLRTDRRIMVRHTVLFFLQAASKRQ